MWHDISTAPKDRKIVIGCADWTLSASYVEAGEISEPEIGPVWFTDDINLPDIPVETCTATHWTECPPRRAG